MRNVKTPRCFRRVPIIDKKTKKVKRIAFKPNDKVKALHREVLQAFKGFHCTTVRDCIEPHLNSTYFVKMDIQNAFGSADIYYVQKALEHVVHFGGNECFFFHRENGLIQGAHASPLIFELFCNTTVDQELAEYCDDRGIVYTRYVDDLIFSSSKPIPRSMRKVLRKIIRKHGLELNPQKDVVSSVWKKSLRVLGTEIRKKYVRVPSAYLNEYVDYLTLLRDGDESLRNIVNGKRAWIRYVQDINRSY